MASVATDRERSVSRERTKSPGATTAEQNYEKSREKQFPSKNKPPKPITITDVAEIVVCIIATIAMLGVIIQTFQRESKRRLILAYCAFNSFNVLWNMNVNRVNFYRPKNCGELPLPLVGIPWSWMIHAMGMTLTTHYLTEYEL